jgi:hypothetical protein
MPNVAPIFDKADNFIGIGDRGFTPSVGNLAEQAGLAKFATVLEP